MADQAVVAEAFKCFVIVCCSSSFFAPITFSTTFPSFKSMKVGIASISYSSATDCHQTRKHEFPEHTIFYKGVVSFSMYITISQSPRLSETKGNNSVPVYCFSFIYFTFNSSTSTLRKIADDILLANSAKKGDITRQGPHHVAAKSTTICMKRTISRL